MSTPAPTARRTDDVVAALLGAVGVASVLVTAWIGLRSTDALVRLVTHPLSLDQTQALLTGLLSADLMLLQVVCLARLPWLERAWGRDVLVRRHRVLGQWSFWLLVVHVALFALQRSTREGNVGGALWALFVTDRHMLLATIATVLVVLVVVSSIAGARRRLRYETWHLLHLWAYVGMGLALPHMLVSADFVGTWTTAYWWASYLLVLALVLVFRVALPLWRSARHRLVVSEVARDASGATSVTMTGRDLAGLGARPGQFLVWRFLGGRGWTRGHPYSLSAAPGPTSLRITVAGGGDGTRRVAQVPVGTRVLVEGPYGGFTLERRRHPRVLMLAAGVGVTPFRSLLEAAVLAPGEATLVVRSHGAGVLGEELAVLCAERGVELVVLTGPRRTTWSWLPEGVEGGPAEVLTRLVPDVAERDVYLCGPSGWSTAVRAAALRAGVAPRDLHVEQFAW